MLESFLKFFVVFFLVVEPISLVPVFATLTEGASATYRRRMAVKAVVVAAFEPTKIPVRTQGIRSIYGRIAS